MPTIYDNITMPFLENDQGNGLRDALKLALRGDFCVGCSSRASLKKQCVWWRLVARSSWEFNPAKKERAKSEKNPDSPMTPTSW
ncbi:MAG: hypothetical protein ACYC67_13080 [Prosthecobacter sp.]